MWKRRLHSIHRMEVPCAKWIYGRAMRNDQRWGIHDKNFRKRNLCLVISRDNVRVLTHLPAHMIVTYHTQRDERDDSLRSLPILETCGWVKTDPPPILITTDGTLEGWLSSRWNPQPMWLRTMAKISDGTHQRWRSWRFTDDNMSDVTHGILPLWLITDFTHHR